ncbi:MULTISPECIES: ATP-binding protein [unclassified Streptomyces]|uniref:ATP-binding protein n=1 Tax=unclassified Streptomyces TaxID=2593676 RepID=UPI00055AD0DE|nr:MULTISPECIES: ATP-binding protein [unclassified Streptomyces]
MTVRPTRAPAAEELLLDTRFHSADLVRLRLRVHVLASAAGLLEPRLAAFVLAAHEVTCNAVRHAGASGTLRLYRGTDTLRCQVTDQGPGFDEDSIPCTSPDPHTATDGRGLWIVRQMTDGMKVDRHLGGAQVTFTMGLIPT